MNQRIVHKLPGATGLAAVIVMASVAWTCSVTINPPPPPFAGGIRVTATLETEASNGQIISTAPVFGAADTGQMTYNYGGGTGNQSYFAGTTNNMGFDSHPQAVTNSIWNIGVNFGSLGMCANPANVTGVHIPIQGGIINAYCAVAG